MATMYELLALWFLWLCLLWYYIIFTGELFVLFSGDCTKDNIIFKPLRFSGLKVVLFLDLVPVLGELIGVDGIVVYV